MNSFWYFAKVQGGRSGAGRPAQGVGQLGQIQPRDMVIRTGEKQWIAASSVGWLFAVALAASPPRLPRRHG